MKQYTKIIAGIWIFAFALWFVFYVKAAPHSQVTLSLTEWVISYNVSGWINLGARPTSFDAYTKDVVNGTFANNTFLVEDLKWTAWSVTIQAQPLVSGLHTISAANIFAKTGAASSVMRKWDITCGTDTTLNWTRTWLATPKIWLSKGNNWKVCKTAITPMIWVDIPASQAVWVYSWELTITSTNAWTPNNLLVY